VIDEASRVKEESWWAVRSTLTHTKGPIRIIGNVKGRSNWAYKLGQRAKNSDNPDLEYHKITAYDAVEAGVLDAKEIEDAKDILPDSIFRELYLAEPGDDGGNPFGIKDIHECVMKDDKGNNVVSSPTSFETDEKPVCWGWDVAKGGNYTVGIALDSSRNVCRFRRWQDSWEGTIRKIIGHTKRVPALVDATGSGDVLLERLREDGGNNYAGYVFTTRSKQDLMISLAVAIQNYEISYPDGPIVEELELFEYEERRNLVVYTAPEGYNDDCVDALALSLYKWRGANMLSGGIAPPILEQDSYWKE
jgi:hypothetical protein